MPNRSSGFCVWNPVANAVAGLLPVQIAHAGGCTQQPRHDVEGNVGGVRFAVGGEHVDTPSGC